jgi:hypothetical protein
MGLLLGCGPTPSEVLGGNEGSAGSSTGTSSTSGGTTRGASSGSGPGVEGTGDVTGIDPDTTGSDGTTQGVQPGTSTGNEATSSTSTGGEPGSTSTGGEPGSSSAGPSPSCDELYGGAPGYILCMESDSECRFNATTGGGDCNMMCAQFLGTCIEAFDNPNDPGDECDIVRPNSDDCNTDRGTELCVCSK